MASKCEPLHSPDYYAQHDAVWKELGLAAPARRGLINHGIFSLSDLKKLTQQELTQIHGIGKNALAILEPHISTD